MYKSSHYHEVQRGLLVRFSRQIELGIPKDVLFELLSRPEKLIPLIPGVQGWKVIDDSTFELEARVGFSALVKGNVRMRFQTSEKRENTSVKIVGISNSLRSSIHMTLLVKFEDTQSGTRLTWNVDGIFEGMVSHLGEGLLRSVAERYTREITWALKESAIGRHTGADRDPLSTRRLDQNP